MKFADRLYRNTDQGKLAGVCAGIADFTRIDALWIRLGFVALALAKLWIAIVVYIALAVLVPEGTENERRSSRDDTRNNWARPTRPTRRAPTPAEDRSIDAEIEEMRARISHLETDDARSTNFGEMPRSLEGDTSRKSGRTLEGEPADKRKVLNR